MAECMPAEIWIGGPVRAADVPGLCKAIDEAVVALEWGDLCFHPTSAAELLAARIDLEQELVLRLCDDQARFGHFEELEAFLQRQGIPFDRQSDGKYEYDPLFVQFRPEGKWSEVLTDHSGNPTIRTEPLYGVATQLAAGLSSLHQGAWPEALAAIGAAYQNLHEQLPPAVLRLPTFQIVADAS